MLLFFHVIIAVASIVQATFLLMKPSKKLIDDAYTLIGLTFLTGVGIVVTKPSAMAHTCESGLAYLAVVSVMVYAAHRRLAGAELE